MSELKEVDRQEDWSRVVGMIIVCGVVGLVGGMYWWVYRMFGDRRAAEWRKMEEERLEEEERKREKDREERLKVLEECIARAKR